MVSSHTYLPTLYDIMHHFMLTSMVTLSKHTFDGIRSKRCFCNPNRVLMAHTECLAGVSIVTVRIDDLNASSCPVVVGQWSEHWWLKPRKVQVIPRDCLFPLSLYSHRTTTESRFVTSMLFNCVKSVARIEGMYNRNLIPSQALQRV